MTPIPPPCHKKNRAPSYPALGGGWQLDMFGAKPDADQAGWNAAQQRPLSEQPHSQGGDSFLVL